MTSAKQNRPLVSIGLPVYNEAEHLAQALDSLLGQDYENIEVIISDNASTDGTPQICADYAGKDGRVRYHRNETNIGGINNFNINNIPVGRYRISARLTNGKTLKMRKTGYDYAPLFGLKPSEAVGAATLLFVPSSAEPRSGHPSHSNWRPADVELQLP